MDATLQLNAALAGRYAVEREIGRGGMATVYLARDLRHDRRVALKVLNAELGAILGVERFLAEIKVTANLQHPNLLPLFDSGEADGLLFYVMPYVEGESLRQRLAREKQLPVDEAVRIAVAVGGALDYAHRHGVIHRDLKPENILLHEGEPLVADFGIALAVSNAGGNRITQTGLSLGTPQYMSPEQATGDRAIDARTDVYSLGAVLYEMLTGDPPHLGSTAQAIIAKVLTDRPRPVRASRPSVPAHVEASVERALEKLPADRFATARDFTEALLGRVHVARETASDATTARLPRSTAVSRMRRAALAIVAGVVLLGIGGAAGWLLRRGQVPPIPVRFTIVPPTGVTIATIYGSPFAIAPDGRTLVYVGGTNRMLYLRRLDELASHALVGTENAQLPTFSPDGKWIVFWAGRLKKIAIDGGPVVTISDVTNVDAVSWDQGDRILVSVNGGLAWIPASGGGAQVFRPADAANGQGFMWPHLLHDGKTVLFAATRRRLSRPGPAGGTPVGGWRIGLTSIDGSGTTILDLPGTFPLEVRDGYLIYGTQTGAIMAVPVDIRRRRVLGTPVPVVENVLTGANGVLKVSVSERGSLVYHTGSDATQLYLIDSRGAASSLGTGVRNFGYPRFSPDGRRIAVSLGDGQGLDVWIYDVASATLQRLTTTEGSRPEWTPDGKRVVYRHETASGGEELWWQRADGSAPAERLFVAANPVPEGIVSPDGNILVYRVNHPTTGRDLWYRRLSGDTTPHPIATSEFDELEPRLSPDGKWLAYVSEKAGNREVFIQPFPELGSLTQISVDGGDEPLWSRDGKRVYYRSGDRFVAAVLTFGADGPQVSARENLFAGDYPSGGVHTNWDVAPDGRFLIVKPVGDGPQTVYVHDWRAELRSRMSNRR